MAKGGSKDKQGGAGETDGAAGWSVDGISEALRDAGKRAAELAQNPYARSLLAAGLVAAAAALASNKNVREATRRNLRTATEAAEAGAENVGKVGIAIVNAATEAVQRMMSLAGAAADATGAAAPKQAAATGGATRPKKAPAKKPAAAKPAATAKAPSSRSRKPAAKPAAAKTQARKPAAKKPG